MVEQDAFMQGILSEIGLGLWSFELDEGVPPRMYGNAAMDVLIGCEGQDLTPEEYYEAWYIHVDKNHLHAVKEVVDRIVAGEFAEVTYPYHHPKRGLIQVVCGGRRDVAYTKGVRVVGRHQDITELVNVRAKAKELEIVRRDMQTERYRTDMHRRINDTFEVLLGEENLRTALERIMIMWCEALGAQWCYLGEYRQGVYMPVYSCAVKGETPLYNEDDTAEISTALYNRGPSDFLAMPDFWSHPLSKMLFEVSPHPELIREVSSCYSHIIHRNGKRWGSLVLSFRDKRVLTPDEVDFFVALSRGVELALERDSRMREIADERDHAVEAEKARSLFFSSVSHDIRTPLNAIIGFAELLELGVAEEADRMRYVATIRSSGRMLAQLVDDILDLSKLENGKLNIIREPTDVPSVIREVVEAFGIVQAKKSIELRSEIGEMPCVSVDPRRLRQLLYNLMSNACKYTDHGNVILRSSWRDGTLSLSVEDTGCGIAQADIDRILQPFVQLSDRNHRDGTGLGLPICRRLSQLMGGDITIRSEVGKGSVFTVTFTADEVKCSQAPSSVLKASDQVSTSLSSFKPTRVLVVDDSAVNRTVLKAMLSRCGLKDIVLAENGAMAMRKLREDPAIDLVLTDLWMPELDGEGLVKAVRADESLAQLPVHLITADVEAVANWRELGFSGILLKPVTLEKLKSLLGV